MSTVERKLELAEQKIAELEGELRMITARSRDDRRMIIEAESVRDYWYSAYCAAAEALAYLGHGVPVAVDLPPSAPPETHFRGKLADRWEAMRAEMRIP